MRRAAMIGIVGWACAVAACGNEQPAPDQRPNQLAPPGNEPEPARAEPASGATGDAPEDRATVAVGDAFSCAIHERAAWCWGDGSKGQLGESTRASANGPVRVVDGAVAVAAGATHACAIRTTGRATCWGTRDGETRATLPAQLAEIEVAGIAAGGDRSCLRSERGDLLCVEPDGALDTRPLPGPRASAVRVGAHHACARFIDGRAHCWGHDLRGGLGASAATGVVRLALGVAHTCALLDDGIVRCWGDVHPDRRETTAVPGPFDRATDAFSVVAGGMHTCTRARDGTSRCHEVVQERVWPDGARGRAVSRSLSLPAATVEAALGRAHHCVRDSAGAVSCWGNDDHAQSSGTTGTDYRAEPSPVALP